MRRVEELTLRLMDGVLSEDEVRELEDVLARDPEALRFHEELLVLEGILRGERHNLDIVERTSTQILQVQGERILQGVRDRIRQERPGRARRRPSTDRSWERPLVWVLAGLAAAAFVLVLQMAGDVPRASKDAGARRKVAPPEPERIPEPERPVLPPPQPESPKPIEKKPDEPRLVPVPVPPRETERREEPPPPARPPKPTMPAAPTIVERVVVAALDRVEGVVDVEGAAATAGLKLRAGDQVKTAVGGRASIVFPDGTRLDLGPESALGGLAATPAKNVTLSRGALSADVPKQPVGAPLILATVHAHATVLGTRLTLAVDADATRLEVQEGRVRLTRLEDGASAEVGRQSYAVAAKGAPPVARLLPRTLLSEDFENARAAAERWTAIPGDFAAKVAGRLEVDLVRPSSPPVGPWYKPGGLQSRGSFRLPFRISLDIEATSADADINPGIVFRPAGAKDVKDAFWVDHYPLGGRTIRLMDEGTQQLLTTGTAPAELPRLERWVIELDGDALRVLIDGKEVLRTKHGKKVHEAYALRLEANAGPNVPRGSKVWFDNVRVEELPQRQR